MPFGGRPSDACEPCRKGRLRCDRVRPSCTQCLRKSITCFGYREVSLLLFKDESESTARKQMLNHGLDHVPNCSALDIMLSPSCSPTPSYNELALGYFMSSYVPASPFDYLPKTYNIIASTAQNAVSSSVLAASFASLSLHVGSDELMAYARTHYSKALSRTNVALASPDTAKLDSSLVSVLLLGFYEAIAFSGQQSPTSWTAHTLGAVALIRLRGTKQLETSLGQQLFLQTCNNIRSSCIQRSVTVPDEFLRLYEQAKPFLDPKSPHVLIGPLLDKIASFKSRLPGIRGQVPKMHGIVCEALQLEEEAQVVDKMLSHKWRYQVKPLHMVPPSAYQGLAHQYPAHFMVRHWNNIRLIRLFMKEVVWGVAAFVARAKEQGMPEIFRYCNDLDTAALQAAASANHTQIVADILATTPHFLDYNGMTFTPAARFLIWPLTVLVELAMTPEPARRYAIKCLCDIASQARIPQALQAVKAVESKSSTDWWATMFFLCFVLTFMCVLTILFRIHLSLLG
ncbi:hypothetical protein DM02DRAFT_698066 [Periconia macrospinosa]|uniref:Zn(2)-C6 fungal-type domain-containing protein n=1 Tax=Periconia macrospinosa TaxID=97972 RepID=A0A2V1D4G9_9PLEO|nr:hypothetical protein DM02DRAFT_698066 [Periconia macrospinosa]